MSLLYTNTYCPTYCVFMVERERESEWRIIESHQSDSPNLIRQTNAFGRCIVLCCYLYIVMQFPNIDIRCYIVNPIGGKGRVSLCGVNFYRHYRRHHFDTTQKNFDIGKCIYIYIYWVVYTRACFAVFLTR